MTGQVFSRHRTLATVARAQQRAQPADPSDYLPLVPCYADESCLDACALDDWRDAQTELYYA